MSFYPSPLIEGILIRRYKRFLCDIRIPGRGTITAHCPNTGAMTGCSEPGWKVRLSVSDNAHRKYPHTWEQVCTPDGVWIGVNPLRANEIVATALPEMMGAAVERREVPFGNSRLDLLMKDGEGKQCYVEVKSVTLVEQGSGLFPDARSARAARHVEELISVVRAGHRAVMVLCVQRQDVEQVGPAHTVDPEYAQAVAVAQRVGVEMVGVRCRVESQSIVVDSEIAFTQSAHSLHAFTADSG